MATVLPTPSFSINLKRMFREYDYACPLLAWPYYNPHTVLSLNFAWLSRVVPLLWGGGGTRHKSPVPIYTFGLDKSIFSRILTPRGANGQSYPQLALGPVPDMWLRGRLPVGQNYI